MVLDITAPIIPFEGMGGIKLYSTREDLADILALENVESEIVFEKWIEYTIQNSLKLLFHLKNNKLFLMRALDDYQGKVFGKIGMGMTEEEIIQIESSFVYDDFEEVWETDKGIIVETDAATHKARWISVYIPEMYADDFDECNW